MIERTFAMIKPDAVAAKNSGKIIDMIEANGFTILGMQKMIMLDKKKAEEFYAVHKERPFFGELVSFVTSGPVIVLALEKDNAVKAWRDLMGATESVKLIKAPFVICLVLILAKMRHMVLMRQKRQKQN